MFLWLGSKFKKSAKKRNLFLFYQLKLCVPFKWNYGCVANCKYSFFGFHVQFRCRMKWCWWFVPISHANWITTLCLWNWSRMGLLKKKKIRSKRILHLFVLLFVICFQSCGLKSKKKSINQLLPGSLEKNISVIITDMKRKQRKQWK